VIDHAVTYSDDADGLAVDEMGRLRPTEGCARYQPHDCSADEVGRLRSTEGSGRYHPRDCSADSVSIFSNTIANLTEPAAIHQLEQAMQAKKSRKIYIVNAHTLNIAASNQTYAAVLRRADLMVSDGTGVRLAARLRGVKMKANLNGTDLMPAFLGATAGRRYRCFLLGADADTIERAADYFRRNFAGWTLAGYHHGYLTAGTVGPVIAEINRAEPDLLLVGMGNPLQEAWIDAHAASLRVGICIGTGGMFDHWAGNLRRAAPWVRSLGCEWVQLLLQQPHKARRYLIGNPRFVGRMLRSMADDRRLSAMTDARRISPS
jgi:N-acetylglucosaminyldiphosphoundecaprenol N-acetyl-beta-D-mannosaminyltransferase